MSEKAVGIVPALKSSLYDIVQNHHSLGNYHNVLKYCVNPSESIYEHFDPNLLAMAWVTDPPSLSTESLSNSLLCVSSRPTRQCSLPTGRQHCRTIPGLRLKSHLPEELFRSVSWRSGSLSVPLTPSTNTHSMSASQFDPRQKRNDPWMSLIIAFPIRKLSFPVRTIVAWHKDLKRYPVDPWIGSIRHLVSYA
jgi:hypothetical protein